MIAEPQLKVAYILRGYVQGSDTLVAEYDLPLLSMDTLRGILNAPADTLLVDCYPLNAVQAQRLNPFLSGPIDLSTGDFFIESHAA